MTTRRLRDASFCWDTFADQTMIEYMERGFPLEGFLDDFPTISLEQAQTVLRLQKQVMEPDESVAG